MDLRLSRPLARVVANYSACAASKSAAALAGRQMHRAAHLSSSSSGSSGELAVLLRPAWPAPLPAPLVLPFLLLARPGGRTGGGSSIGSVPALRSSACGRSEPVERCGGMTPSPGTKTRPPRGVACGEGCPRCSGGGRGAGRPAGGGPLGRTSMPRGALLAGRPRGGAGFTGRAMLPRECCALRCGLDDATLDPAALGSALFRPTTSLARWPRSRPGAEPRWAWPEPPLSPRLSPGLRLSGGGTGGADAAATGDAARGGFGKAGSSHTVSGV
jgi:hypothetical protein